MFSPGQPTSQPSQQVAYQIVAHLLIPGKFHWATLQFALRVLVEVPRKPEDTGQVEFAHFVLVHGF